MVSRPALTTLALPLTGAARKTVPLASAALRTSCGGLGRDRAGVDEVARRHVAAEAAPPGPDRDTASRSASAATIVNTTSRSARSAAPADDRARRGRRGPRPWLRVRFQTWTSWPAFSRRAAIAWPIRPVPIQPMRLPRVVIAWSSFITGSGRGVGAVGWSTRAPAPR